MERRLNEFLPELKDYYTITSEGEFFSDNSGKMKLEIELVQNIK